MKRLLIPGLLASVFIISACNSEKAENKNMTDSIESAAAADSMLKEALGADTLGGDTVRAVDTLSTSDSLK
ncbi:MAG: hypothetical protein ABI390_11045 [Daejeonella sp.]